MSASLGQIKLQKPFQTTQKCTRTSSKSIVCLAQPQKNHVAIATTAASLLHAAPSLAATEAIANIADGSSMSLALGGGAAIVALSAALIATDPQNRRSAQMAETGGNELEAVKNYFDTAGFERWRKIYGETDDVNKVQKDIREGHAQTVDKVLAWLDEEGGVQGVTILDAGCGTGSLAIPMALRVRRMYRTLFSFHHFHYGSRTPPSKPLPHDINYLGFRV